MSFKAYKSGLTMNEIEEEYLLLTDVVNKTGFLYFLENYVYVEHAATGYSFMKDDMFDWQRKAATKFLSSRYIISKKMRQVGFSTLVGAYSLWRGLFFESQMMNVVSLKQLDSTTFLRRTKFIYEHLPLWLKQKKSEDQKTSMTFEHNHSKLTSLPLTDDPARGDTLSLLVLDEFAMMKNAKNVLASGVPSLASGSMIPFTNTSIPSQLFIISTFPHENIVDNEYVRLLNVAREDKQSGYALIEVDPWDIVYYKSESWHKEQLDILGPRRYAIEIKGEEPIDSDNALLPPHILQTLASEPPIRCDFLFPDDIDDEGYYKDLNAVTMMKDEFDSDYHYIRGLWIWEDPQPNTDYCITCDVAKGVGGSASSFQIINLNTMEQAAEFNNDRMDIETYKKAIETVTKYYNDAKLSIENNGLGIGVVQYFSTTICYSNLYYFKHSKKKYEAGFPMGLKTRGVAIANMQSVISNYTVKLKSIRLINQLRSFGYTNSGKVKGMGQAKDDLVLAFAQFCYLLTTGWAVSYSTFKDQRPVGIINMDYDEQKKLEEEENRPKKYWESTFDDYDLDDKKKELLKMLDAQGLSISNQDLERFLNN